MSDLRSRLSHDDTTCLAGRVRPGEPAYRRERDLPRLIAIWPQELAAAQRADNAAIVAKIKRALRTERQRGIAGHWTYDLARHYQLLEALKAETASAAGSGTPGIRPRVRRGAG